MTSTLVRLFSLAALVLRSLRINYRSPLYLAFGLVVPFVLIYFFHPLVEQSLKCVAFLDQDSSYPTAAQQVVVGTTLLFATLQAAPLCQRVAEERKLGIWRRFLITPIWRPAVFIAPSISIYTQMLINTTVIFLVGWIGYGLNVGNEVFALALVLLIFLTIPAGFGVLVASWRDNTSLHGQVIYLAVLTSSFVGGTIAPMFIQEEWVHITAHVTPQYWAVNALLGLMARDQNLVNIAPALLALVAYSFGLWYLALANFRRKDYL